MKKQFDVLRIVCIIKIHTPQHFEIEIQTKVWKEVIISYWHINGKKTFYYLWFACPWYSWWKYYCVHKWWNIFWYHIEMPLFPILLFLYCSSNFAIANVLFISLLHDDKKRARDIERNTLLKLWHSVRDLSWYIITQKCYIRSP